MREEKTKLRAWSKTLTLNEGFFSVFKIITVDSPKQQLHLDLKKKPIKWKSSINMGPNLDLFFFQTPQAFYKDNNKPLGLR